MSSENETSWTQWGRHVLATLKELVAGLKDCDSRIGLSEGRIGRLEERCKAMQSHIDAIDRHGPRSTGQHAAVEDTGKGGWKELFRPPQIFLTIAVVIMLAVIVVLLIGVTGIPAADFNPMNGSD